MALVRDLSSAQLVFKVGDGAVDQFDVVRYRGTEGLSQLYRFEIELVTDEEELSFDDIVGRRLSPRPQKHPLFLDRVASAKRNSRSPWPICFLAAIAFLRPSTCRSLWRPTPSPV